MIKYEEIRNGLAIELDKCDLGDWDTWVWVETADKILKYLHIGESSIEYHEHPFFYGQYHMAVWEKTWTSGGTNGLEAPEGTPISCAICGRVYGH